MAKVTFDGLTAEVRKFFLDNENEPGTSMPLTGFMASDMIISKLSLVQIAEVLLDAAKKPKTPPLQKERGSTDIEGINLYPAYLKMLTLMVEAAILTDKAILAKDKQRRRRPW